MSENATVPDRWRARASGSGPRPAAARRGFVQRGAAHAQALERVRGWTRARFALAEDVVVVVAELACTVPGCPPLETVVAFWTAPERRHHFKIFKPVAEIVGDDLPPAWLKDALVVPDGGECDCC